MLVLSAGTAHALGDYLTQFTARYGNTGTEAASCKLCHAASNSGSSFNRYGVDLDARGGGAATGDITDNLIAVETLNSDGVGGTNLAEIQGGTQPGWCVATTAGCNNNGVTTLPAGVVNLPLDPTVAGNQPPVLNPIGAKTVNEGQPLTFTATATDPNGNALTFSGGNLPTGATLTPAGAFSWTPSFTQGQTTPYSVTITVTDNGSPVASDFETFTITVGNVNQCQPAAGAGADRCQDGDRGTAPHLHGHGDGPGRQRADVLGGGSAHRRDFDTGGGLQLDADDGSGRQLQRHRHRHRYRGPDRLGDRHHHRW